MMAKQKADPDFFLDFSQMTKEIVSARNLTETIQLILRHIGRVFSPQNWSLLLKERKTGRLKFVYVTGKGAEKIQGITLEKNQGVAGWVALHRENVIVEDTSCDTRFDNGFDQVTGFHTRSIIAVPLVARGKVFGVIELINKLDDSFYLPQDLLVLQAIADFAAISIEKIYYQSVMRRLALTDPLTGLSNRRSFEKILEREIELTRRKGSLFVLLLIDIDQFKAINDQLGHSAGDEALRSLARILRESLRKIDCAARLGGDEFAVLLPQTDREGAENLVARLRSVLAQLPPPGPISISVGVSLVDPEHPERILNQADQAMYREKDRIMEDADLNLSDHLEFFLEEERRQAAKTVD